MSEMAAEERERLENFKETLRDKIEVLLQDAFDVLEGMSEADDAQYPNYLRVVYELWANSMGVMDALCCLRGVPQDMRHRSMRRAMQHGRITVLERHTNHCSGCEGSRILEDEIDSVN